MLLPQSGPKCAHWGGGRVRVCPLEGGVSVWGLYAYMMKHLEVNPPPDLGSGLFSHIIHMQYVYVFDDIDDVVYLLIHPSNHPPPLHPSIHSSLLPCFLPSFSY